MIAQSTRAKIHIARQQLGMDDDTYRAMLERVAGSGVRSSNDLTPLKAAKVLSEFERLGFTPKARKTKGKPKNFASNSMPAMITKIEAQLADMGLAWSYADAIAQHMFKIEKCAWVRQPKQLKGIIAALHVEQEKRGLLAQLEELMADVGASDPKWPALLERQREGWQRHRPTLRKLVDALMAAKLVGESHVDG